MNQEQVVREFSGKIIGYVITDDKGNKTVKDFYRRIIGYYDKSTDTTRDFYRRIIARGDQSSMLFNLKSK